MKKIIGILLMVVMVLPLLLGCGIPQEEHDAVLAERDAAQAQVASLQSELDNAQNQVGTLESDLAKAESEVETLESDLSQAKDQVESLQSSVAATQTEYNTFKSDLKSAYTSLDRLLEINYVTLGINAEILLDNLDGVYEGCILMTGKLASLGDSELEALWEEAYAADGARWDIYFKPFESFMEALAERINSEREALSNKF